MYPDSQFARPVSSFRKPAPIIDIDPDDSPDATVCFRSEWIPYIVGSLRQLLLQSTWDTSDRDVLNLMQARAQLLIALFIEGCAELKDVRQNTELPCKLEKTFDGETWEQFANLQLCPPKIRVGAGGGVEWFDGTGWVPLPGGGDERYDGGYNPPWPTPPSGQTGNCLAAENIVAVFETSMLQGKVALEAGMIAMGIIASIGSILAPFMPAAIFVAVASSIGGMIFDGGTAFLTDVTSTTNLDTFKCAIETSSEADGSITADDFSAIKSYLDAKMTDATIRALYEFWCDGLGPVGMSRMGAAAGINSGDCASCDEAWTVKMLGTWGNEDKIMLISGRGGTSPASTIVGGEIIYATEGDTWWTTFKLDFSPGALITYIRVSAYEVESGGTGIGGGVAYDTDINTPSFGASGPSHGAWDWSDTPNTTLSNLIYIQAGNHDSRNVTYIEVRGIGFNPFA